MDLIPSWMILRENIDSNFSKIEDYDIDNLQQLQNALKTKFKVDEFANLSGISLDYLTVLRRMINGYHPKANKYSDVPNISIELIKKLEENGIRTTRDIYSKVITVKDRIQLASELEISIFDVDQLAKLSDVSRIRWVNHTFAFVLVESGYDNPTKIAKADFRELYNDIKELNDKRKIYKGQIGLNDMKLLVYCANDVPQEIEY